MELESSTIGIIIFGVVVCTMLYIGLHTNLVKDVSDKGRGRDSKHPKSAPGVATFQYFVPVPWARAIPCCQQSRLHNDAYIPSDYCPQCARPSKPTE